MKIKFKKVFRNFFSFCSFLPSTLSPFSYTLGASRRGQMALMMVLTILMFLLIMVPVIEKFVQNEGKWSMKSRKTGLAFNLAEAGIDRAVWKLTESTDMWNVTSSQTVTGYNFDKTYADIEGGEYSIEISSHPTDSKKRIVKSVGKDFSSKEFRAIKVVYKNTASADFATRAEGQVTNAGLLAFSHIEWGPVIAGVNINATGHTYPRYFSAGHVTPQDGGSTLPGTDDVYWWSYYDIPNTPEIDFDFYIASATNANADPCGGNYYTDGSRTFKGCHDTSGNTYYVTEDLTFKAGSGGNFILGNVIVLGDIKFAGNGGTANAPDGSYLAKVPPEAWKEYGGSALAWARYNVFDPAYSGSYDDALSSNYVATGVTYPIVNVIVHGFLYTGGSQGLVGGGNGRLHGVLMSGEDATMSTSNFRIYYDNEVASGIQILGLNLVRESWHEITPEWPAGL